MCLTPSCLLPTPAHPTDRRSRGFPVSKWAANVWAAAQETSRWRPVSQPTGSFDHPALLITISPAPFMPAAARWARSCPSSSSSWALCAPCARTRAASCRCAAWLAAGCMPGRSMHLWLVAAVGTGRLCRAGAHLALCLHRHPPIPQPHALPCLVVPTPAGGDHARGPVCVRHSHSAGAAGPE